MNLPALKLGPLKAWYERLKSCLKYLVMNRRFGCRSTVRTLNEGPKASLERLPVEILQSISCHLSISATACLTLCSHQMRHILGTQTWHTLQTQPSEKAEFLSCLEKDFPDHRLCHRCVKFHRRIPSEDVRLDFRASHPKCDNHVREGMLYSNPCFRLRYHHVQLAMNRHRFGLSHGMSLDHMHLPPSQSMLHGGYHPSSEARIVADELILRLKYGVLMQRSSTSAYFNFQKMWMLCPHINTFHGDRKRQMMDLIECQLRHRDTGPCENCSGLWQCHACPTEYEIKVCRAGAAGHILEATTWRNLGSGRTHNDPKWQQQLGHDDNNPYRWRAFAFNPGSIRSAFESQGNGD